MKELRLTPYDGPTYYLHKYKTTQRPRPCQICEQNAYYFKEEWGYLCAPHILDLLNIGELLWHWSDYPEMWDRTERLLQRSTGATATESQSENQNTNTKNQLDG